MPREARKPLPGRFLLPELHHGDAVFPLAVPAQAEGFYRGVPLELLVDRLAQGPRALAVDDGDHVELAHDGAVQELVHLEVRLVGHEAPDVQLIDRRPGSLQADCRSYVPLGLLFLPDLGLLHQPDLAGLHGRLHIPGQIHSASKSGWKS